MAITNHERIGKPLELSPRIEQTPRPDRVRLTMPMVSLLPEESVARVRSWLGARHERLVPLELQALVTADVVGAVPNVRMQEVSGAHPADRSRMLG